MPGFATCSPSHHPGTYRQALRVAAYSIAHFRDFQVPRPTTAQPIRQDCAAGITIPMKHCKCCAMAGVELARSQHRQSSTEDQLARSPCVCYCQRTSASAMSASYGVSVGFWKPSPQSMERRGQAICIQASTPSISASFQGATSDSSTCTKHLISQKGIRRLSSC